MTRQVMAIDALCPLDGRYASRIGNLQNYFSEAALQKARVEVELRYLLALSDWPNITEVRALPQDTKERITQCIVEEFSAHDLEQIREHERRVNHDVKAVEYWLRAKIDQNQFPLPATFVHFALTSEDVTNLAYGLLIHRALREAVLPDLYNVRTDIDRVANEQNTIIIGMTHGQPATPTMLKEQLHVFTDRLNTRLADLECFRMNGKFGGAVGNYSAHYAAYPEIEWRKFGSHFVTSLGLIPLKHAAQINPHDDIAHLSHLMIEFNTILLDLCVDMWLYISRGIFRERIKEGEVGSSTMPNKVNPLDWENAEGNLGIANALFAHFAEKLPRSRLQRDLSDSTVQRWIGTAFGAHCLAVKSILKGLTKVEVDRVRAQEERVKHPEIHSEAIQTVMRRYGYTDAYEQLKDLTRGKEVTAELLKSFVTKLSNVPEEAKKTLLARLANY